MPRSVECAIRNHPDSNMRKAFWLAAFLLCFAITSACGRDSQGKPVWTGRGARRLLVRVDPVDLKGRQKDELVARHRIHFKESSAGLGIREEADLSTIQVHKYDPQTGQAEPFPNFEGAVSPF